EWEAIYRRLVEMPSYFDADQKTYDLKHGKLTMYYINFMGGLASKLGYSPADVEKVKKLCYKMGRYNLMLEGNLILCDSGLCSGRSDTVHFNSVVLKLSVYYTYFRLTTFNSPARHLRGATVGDDLILSFCDSIRERFTGPAFVSAFAELGYVVTDGGKAEVMEVKTIYQLSFLKRTFFPYRGRIFGPLQKKSIYKSLCYVCGVPEKMEEERNRNALLCAVKEFFLHGKEPFDNFKNRVLELHPGLAPRLKSYEEYEELYASGLLFTWSVDPELVSSTTGRSSEEGVIMHDTGYVEQSSSLEKPIRYQTNRASNLAANLCSPNSTEINSGSPATIKEGEQFSKVGEPNPALVSSTTPGAVPSGKQSTED
ncbi:MAG: hypothetical protein NWF07_14420, partial [Candidatus Bathyarchaeota archaeon]|nr:hypothetical protein [Candidatus Bathyarchaeota archaeon]